MDTIPINIKTNKYYILYLGTYSVIILYFYNMFCFGKLLAKGNPTSEINILQLLIEKYSKLHK